MAELSVYDNDPTLYLFTSLTAGSSHIITATSRIETILKANRIPFKGVDTATDELARKLYGRRARGKKLPLLVKEGFVVADLEQVEEWNEFDELKEALGVTGTSGPTPIMTKPYQSPAAAAPAAVDKKENVPSTTSEQNLAIRQLGAEAAKVAAAKKAVPEKISTTNPLLAEKVNSPATSTPTKDAAKADTSGILSPRSIPLPATPNPSTPKDPTEAEKPSIPKLTSKPVHSPPSMHVDAANPDLAKAPISTSTAKSPASSSVTSPTRPSPVPLSPSSGSSVTSPRTEFHGSKIGTASQEEIAQIEKEQTIAEVSSSEEEDSEDERKKPAPKKEAKKEAIKEEESEEEDEEDESEDEDEEDEESEEESEEEEKKEVTQKQSAKAADKAGESVED